MEALMERMWRMSAAAVVMMVATASPAAAQAIAPPHATVNFGVGIANPIDADVDLVPFAWQASVRIATARHFIIEASYGEWRHDETREMTNLAIQGPNGPLGTIDRLTERTEESRPAIAFNLLGAWSTGPVTFMAGGGPGMLVYHRTFTQTSEGCHGVTTCSTYSHSYNNSAFSVQATAGVDVAIASRIGAFGEFRLAVPIQDPAGGQTTAIGGVRVALW
jgi:hypothetical protein